MARIFISHSSRNNAEALALHQWLISQGWTDLFLDIHPVDGLAAAEKWQKALRDSIARCRAVIFCLSSEWLESPFCMAEFWGALQAGAAPVGVIVKPLDTETIPAAMTGVWQLVDLTRGGAPQRFRVAPPPERRETTIAFPVEELRRLREGLAKLDLVGLAPENFAWPPPGETDRPPYRGLKPLDVQDAGVFFGRDADLVRAREALLLLREQGGRRLFVILGASGAGKSSFLRAGLWPRLAREDRDFLVLPIIRPAEAPVSGATGLAQSLWGAFKALGAERPLGDLLSKLERDPSEMPALLGDLQARAATRLVGEDNAQIDRPPTVIIPIDQAEELYAAGSGPEAQQFLGHLAAALSPGLETVALVTIRSDRFEPLQGLTSLAGVPKEPFNLPPVTPFAFREAIVRPASRPDPPIEVAADLVDALIADMAAQGADPLPLLAFTLERLYLNYGRTNGTMTLANYTALGGLKGSLGAALKEAFAKPEAPPVIPADAAGQERLLEAVFVPALVDVNEANDAPLRRIASETEIAKAGRAMVERLVGARLLVQGSRAAQATIEVAHEALLRQWDALKRILDRRSSELKALQAVERATEAWRRNNHAADWLDHKGQRLIEAEQLAARPDLRSRLDGLPSKYLAACWLAEDQRRRHQRRLRRWAQFATSGALVAATVLLIGSIMLNRQTQRREASVMTAVADRAIGESQHERAMRASLQGLPASLRWPYFAIGWSGDEMRGLEAKLAGAAQGSLLRLRLVGHTAEVRSVSFSSDGTRIVTASDDRTARVWDATTGAELYRLAGHAGEVRSAFFSRDGTRIVTASRDKTARVWDAASRAVLLELSGHGDDVFSAAFSPDGRLVVTASADKTARIWDAASGMQLRILSGHTDKVTSAVFSSDGNLVVTGSEDATARIWDARDGTEVKVLPHGISRIRNAAFSPDGARVATASWDQTARLWDVRTGIKLFETTEQHGPIRSAAFNADGTRIVTASDDGAARVWDPASPSPLVLRLYGHGKAAVSAVFSPDGSRIATASEDRTARVWATIGTPEILRRKMTELATLGAAFSPDGRRIVTASADPLVAVWDAATGDKLAALTGLTKVARSASFSPDGKRVAAASDEGTAIVWDAGTGSQIFRLIGHGGAVRSIAFSPDATRLVTASSDRTARVWDAATGAPLVTLSGHEAEVESAAFDQDGTRVVTASDDGTARVWNAKTGAELLRLPLKDHTDRVWSAAFSPDGTRIVTASWDHKTRIWDAASGALLVEFKGHGGIVYAAVFSPDGERVASASWDKTVRVWDAHSATELLRLDGHTAPVRGVAFNADGTRLVTTSEDGTWRIWDTRWLTTLHQTELARRVCEERLVGDAQTFSDDDIAADRTLAGLAGQNPCRRHD